MPNWRDDPAERKRQHDKLSAMPQDNGRLHYGSGLRGSLCGVEGKRRETSSRAHVNCPACITELRKRP